MKRIFLVGYMGSGKTTVGQLLARRMGFSFIDLDAYIENRYLKKINEIFTEFGEERFREMEHNLLKEVSQMEAVVVSTGGGAACYYDNMAVMNQSGVSVYLKLSVHKLAERLYKARSMRPLIKDKTAEELPIFVKEMLDKREPFYSQATLIVDNNENNPALIEQLIFEKISKLNIA